MALVYPILASLVLLSMYYFYSYVQSLLMLYIAISAAVCVGSERFKSLM